MAVNSKVASLLADEAGGPLVMVVSGAGARLAKSGPQNVPEAVLPNQAYCWPCGVLRQSTGVRERHERQD